MAVLAGACAPSVRVPTVRTGPSSSPAVSAEAGEGSVVGVADSVAAWAAGSAEEGRPVTGDQAGTRRTSGLRATPRYGIFRWLQHLWIGPAHVSRAFSKADFLAIEQAISEGESRHRGELRFAIESSLSSSELWNEVDARERAIDVFSHFRMWDTELNSGVLIYVLWADHAVELVADRGVDARVDDAVWQEACALIGSACARKRPVQGVLEAIALLNDALAQALPATSYPRNPNELSNRPLILR